MEGTEIVDVIRRKVKIADILDYLLKSCTYGVCAAAWILSIKCIKYHDLIGRVLVVALHHGKFI